MLHLKRTRIVESMEQLAAIPEGKVLINTINAYSYNNAQKDELFARALTQGDFLIPDGISIVRACRKLHAVSQPQRRIAGWDLFTFEMDRLERQACQTGMTKKVMFMGSSERVLFLIKERAKLVYPHLTVDVFSPPYKPIFNDEDNQAIIRAINESDPDLLWIGMTAPKQEKWAFQHWDQLHIHCHVGTIGAVFDFFAGTYQRAPELWQQAGYEWLYRLIKEPRRMWRRYLIGNVEFFIRISLERFN